MTRDAATAPEYIVVFDAVQKRPACVILQVVLGGDRRVASRFPSRSWLVSPTPDMRRYRCTEDELTQLVTIVEAGGPYRD